MERLPGRPEELDAGEAFFAIQRACQRWPGKFLAGLHWRGGGAETAPSKMISLANINKQYGKRLLFEDVKDDWHWGFLSGRNPGH